MFTLVSMIVLIMLSFPAINAAVTTTTINSPLVEPEPTLSGGFIEIFYVASRPYGTFLYKLHFESSGTFELVPTFPSGNSSNQRLYLTASVNSGSGYVDTYDLLTGSLIEHFVVPFGDINSVNGYYNLNWRYGYFPRTTGIYDINDFNYGYWIVPDNLRIANVSYPESLNVTPFVNWSLKPPEHNQYHSHLSEPVADEYNSYFICNDRLYWLSYRANGLYSFKNSVELSSSQYSETLSYASDGSGTYAGYQNGFSEPVSSQYGYVSGVLGDGTVLTGTVFPLDFGQIDFSGINAGNLRVSSSGQYFYNDIEVYPINYSSQLINRFYDICIYLTDDSGFKVWLYPRSDLGQQLVLSANLFCSVFNLADGSYISSSYSSYSGSYNHAGFEFPLDEKIQDVKCYGCAFYNVNNVAVNLSDVLWNYDLEFAEWRNEVSQYLNMIYYALVGGDDVPEGESYPNYGSDLNEAESGFSDIKPADVKLELNGALGDGKYDSASSQVKDWIDLFSIPKIIGVCVLALALGTVTLTLGKKKSD